MPLEGLGTKITSRPVHFIWLLDCSGSMEGSKIQSLNAAVKMALPEMRDVAKSNAEAQLLVRAIKFSDIASWHIENPVGIEDLSVTGWSDVGPADGVTEVGRAFELATKVLRMPPMEQRALPPVIVLVSDGEPTDADWRQKLDTMMKEPWALKAIRIVIGIGAEVENNAQANELFERFVGNKELYSQRVFFAKNAQQLAHLIRWASTVVVKNASVTKMDPNAPAAPPPVTPPPVNPDPGPDVW